MVDQGEGGAGIVEPPEGEVPGPCLLPEGVMQGSAFRRESNETPPRVAPLDLNHLHGLLC